jgi:ankyrin repeat protein
LTTTPLFGSPEQQGRVVMKFKLIVIIGLASILSTGVLFGESIEHIPKCTPKDEALIQSIRGLDYRLVQNALADGGNPNCRSSALGELARTLSGKGGSSAPKEPEVMAIARLLVDRGAYLRPGKDEWVMFHPIELGYKEFVALLLDRGASPTASLAGYYATELAFRLHEFEIYHLLVARGGKKLTQAEGTQLLFVYAAYMNRVDLLESLYKRGALIDGEDPAGQTALYQSITGYFVFDDTDTKAIRWLLDKRANPNAPSGFGGSKIQANQTYPIHTFVCLTGRKAKPPKVNREDIVDILKHMLKAGGYVSGKDSMGRTPLHTAASCDNVIAAEQLIEANAKVNSQDDSGKTPLDYAESGDLINLLKRSGAKD